MQNIVPSNIGSRILSHDHLDLEGEDNVIAWGPSQNGDFSVSLAYAALLPLNDIVDPLYQVTWQWPGTERIKCFLWKVN